MGRTPMAARADLQAETGFRRERKCLLRKIAQLIIQRGKR